MRDRTTRDRAAAAYAPADERWECELPDRDGVPGETVTCPACGLRWTGLADGTLRASNTDTRADRGRQLAALRRGRR